MPDVHPDMVHQQAVRLPDLGEHAPYRGSARRRGSARPRLPRERSRLNAESTPLCLPRTSIRRPGPPLDAPAPGCRVPASAPRSMPGGAPGIGEVVRRDGMEEWNPGRLTGPSLRIPRRFARAGGVLGRLPPIRGSGKGWLAQRVPGLSCRAPLRRGLSRLVQSRSVTPGAPERDRADGLPGAHALRTVIG